MTPPPTPAPIPGGSPTRCEYISERGFQCTKEAGHLDLHYYGRRGMGYLGLRDDSLAPAGAPTPAVTGERASSTDEGETMNDQPQVQVLSRDAGSALDALVAEKVMGCVRVHVNDYGDVFGAPPEMIASGDIPADHGRTQLPRYSTDIAAAWLVVEHINRHRDVVDWGAWTGAWGYALGRIEMFSSGDLALYVCRAALAAAGVPA